MTRSTADGSQPLGAYQTVYRVLADLEMPATLPAGAWGEIANAIDALKRTAAPPAHIRMAERVAVALHRLQPVFGRADGLDRDAIDAELREIGVRWLDAPLGHA